MRTMPIEQISNSSLRYPKIRANNIDSWSSAISIAEGNKTNSTYEHYKIDNAWSKTSKCI